MSVFQPIVSKTLSFERDELSTAANFDATLSKTTAGASEYKLTLQLRIFLRQINPNPLPHTSDSDGRLFWIKPWSPAEWQALRNGALRQAALWNRQFWLKPPDTVADYDYKDFSSRRLRPFVRCELDVSFVPAPSMAHAVVSAANIDTNQYLNPNGYRSASLTWCSQDNTPSVNAVQGPGSSWNTFTQPVLAHEIGHLLGLYHIGKLMKTPLCQLAMAHASVGLDKVDWRTEGGRNSQYCYGWGQPAQVAQNIMGMGAGFSEENAKPWLWAIQMLRNRPGERIWQVLTAYPGYYF